MALTNLSHRSPPKTNPLLLIPLLALLLVVSSSQTPSQSSSNHFNQTLIENFLPNLLLKHQEVEVFTQIVQSYPFRVFANTTFNFVAHRQYFEQYPSKSTQKIRLQNTPQLKKAVKAGLVFVKTSIFVLVSDKRYLINQQSVSLTIEHVMTEEIGPSIFVIPTENQAMKYLTTNQTEVHVLNKMEIYFFTHVPILYFNREMTKTGFSSIIQVREDNILKKYSIILPFRELVNTKDPENSQAMAEFAEKEDYELEIHIKLSNAQFYPQMLHYLASNQIFSEYWDFKTIFGQNSKFLLQFFVKLLKNWILDPSLLGWPLLITQSILAIFAFISLPLTIIVTIWVVKQGIKYRGISLSAQLMAFENFFFQQILLLYPDFEKSFSRFEGWRQFVFLSILASFSFTILAIMWKFHQWVINKIARVQLRKQYPFMVIQGSEWYKTYEDKDIQIGKKMAFYFQLLTIVIIFYPFLSGFLNNQIDFLGGPSALAFCMKRWALAASIYIQVFLIMTQILLNRQLKSGNGVSWIICMFSLLLYGIDNFPVIISFQFWSALFYLKEEILILVLIYQKLKYGNNLEEMRTDAQRRADDNDGNQGVGRIPIINQVLAGENRPKNDGGNQERMNRVERGEVVGENHADDGKNRSIIPDEKRAQRQQDKMHDA